MRKILFRGFNENPFGEEKINVNGKIFSGTWYNGFFMIERSFGLPMIKTKKNNWKYVIPETVGEYIGIKDKNGKMIFENDIVCYNGTNHKVVFEIRNGISFYGIIIDENKTCPFNNMDPVNQMKIVGNIYDNNEKDISE